MWLLYLGLLRKITSNFLYSFEAKMRKLKSSTEKKNANRYFEIKSINGRERQFVGEGHYYYFFPGLISEMQCCMIKWKHGFERKQVSFKRNCLSKIFYFWELLERRLLAWTLESKCLFFLPKSQ